MSRLILNYKRIPHERHNILRDDIQRKTESLLALCPPSSRQDSHTRSSYSIPFIHDSETNLVISDPLEIADYLDETYPSTPRVIPAGTRVLQYAFTNTVLSNMFALYPVLRPEFKSLLSPELLARQRKSLGSKILDLELETEEAWAKVRGSFEALGRAFGKQKGTFVMGGENPTFADFIVVSFVWCVNIVYGEDSREWRETCGWADGRIGRLCEEVKLICR
ncbi:hypothetical protein PQX77_016346 [Marasmius sp. AFHP31]|nr:hypothetical protein PQX77_016346 [Marasmius sp. AFHP31]